MPRRFNRRGGGFGSYLTIKSNELRIINDGLRTGTQFNTNTAVMADGKGVVNLIADDVYIEGSSSLTAVKGGEINITSNRLMDIKGDIGNYFTESWADPASENKINLTANENSSIHIHDQILLDSTLESKTFRIDLKREATLNTGSSVRQIRGAPEFAEKSSFVIAMDQNAVWKVGGEENHVTKIESREGIIDARNASRSATIKIDHIEGSRTLVPVDDLNMAHLEVGDISGNVTVEASGDLNDATGDSSRLLTGLSRIVETPDTDRLTLVAREGLISDGLTARVGPNGEVVTAQAQTNTYVQSVKNIIENQAIAFRAQSNDVAKRMGDLRSDDGNLGAWARVYGGKNRYKSDDVTNKYRTVQIGSDTGVRLSDGRLFVGLTGSYTEGDSQLDNGAADDKTYGGGFYATYFADNGMYLDVITKYLHMKNDFRFRYADGRTADGDYRTNGCSASLEAGWRLTNESGVYAEPQLEIIFGRVQAFDYDTSAGVHADHDDMDSLIGRIGFSLGKVFDEHRGNCYFNLSILNDFKGSQNAVFSVNHQTRSTEVDIGGAWFEAGLGGNYRLGNHLSLYGEMATSHGSRISNTLQWTVGARLSY